ncbi:response regulator, partial [Pseudomonas proteolytica]|uniref:response regulator n=1 Tax=Pseudomonas proteolytica TaxID=219574 RepID=UPI0030DAD49E
MATILTVDDSPSIRQMIKVVLEPAGHNVIEAGDGAQGLAKAQAGKLDLVITDLNMPVMNGLELIRALRKLPSAVGMVVMAIAELVLLGLVNGFGSDATAAYGAVNQVMGYTQFTAMSISIAVSILGAQAVGGGDRQRLDGIVRT